MTTPVKIIDKDGEEARIIEGALVVSNIPVPSPSNIKFIQIPFIENLSINGDGVSFDLRVDGSVTPIDAFLEARSDGDLYIKTANIIVEDAGNIALEDFGALPALTNGIDTFIENEGIRFNITKQPIKNNFDMIRIGTLTPAVGADDTAFRIKQRLGVGDTLYNPVWDFTRLAGGTEGIRLASNTKQRLGITINDDLTTLTSFNMVLTGYIRLT